MSREALPLHSAIKRRLDQVTHMSQSADILRMGDYLEESAHMSVGEVMNRADDALVRS